MKKAVLLMVLLLMAIFIFSSQVQAQEAVGINWKYFYPVTPHAVPNDGTGSATFEWVIKLPGPAEYSYTYYFNIFHGEMDVIISKEYRVEKGTVSPVVDKYIYNVRKGSPVGTYTAKIRHPYPEGSGIRLEQDFKVGAGNLKILKFNDSNRDGKQDDGELGLSGWTFTIIPPKGRSFDVTTGADGTYTERNLMLGEYTITENQKSGWNSTTPTSQKAKVKEGQPTNVTFGNYEFGRLEIIKFNDTNQNGKVDDGVDERLRGWEFKVTDPKGKTTKYTTDNNGEIKIEVPPGNYIIEEILKGDWSAITSTKQTKNVPKGNTATVQFLNTLPPTWLLIQKFNDTNQNGKVDDGVDERLRGWEFKVTDPKGKTTKYTTDNNGEIKIEVPPGNYIIEEILKGDWSAITSTKQTKNVPKGNTATVQFLNTLPQTWLLIQKFNDTNQNGKVDDGVDERLRGWEFKVTDPDGKTTTHFTNDTGEIEIKIPRKYEGKDYTIEEILKPGCWKPVLPIRQTAKGESKTVQFLNIYEPTVLLIQKFNDTNRNRILDDTEKLSGWEFQVTYPDGKTANYITDSKGEIEIKVPPGSYTVKEIPKCNWTAITPIIQNKNVAECITNSVIFHNLFTPRILLITKYYDHNANGKRDSGEEGIGNWGFKIKYPDGSVETVMTLSDGIYKRYDPPTGKYTISEQPQPCWKNSTPMVRDVEITPDRGAEVEFGNFEVGNLTIQKFYDDNRNKVQEYGEDSLPNWTFTITFPDGSSKRITTDANGTYKLLNVPIGRYTITEEAMTCRWMNSTSTTQYVEVTACQESIASFGNYIADCSIPPGCPWFNEDENLNVSKSVKPCVCNITPLIEGESTSKEEEPKVSVYLRVCVDKWLIKDGIAVENITVVETLYNHFTVVGDSFSEQPRAIKKNPDGTTTITWDIPSLCCEEWNVSFNVTATFALPIDVTDTSERVTSKVIYEDPIETGRQELSIPEGKLKFSFIVPPQPPHPICYVLGGLLVISVVIEITLELKRRKKEKSKEK